MENGVDKGTRLANLAIDVTLVVLLSLLVVVFAGGVARYQLFLYPVFFLYYFFCEWLFGQTLGKRLTKTHVVDLKGQKAKVVCIAIRTLLRFNPFDGFSYLFGWEQGAHDKFSKTKLEKLASIK